ncbi:hypothetical protein C6497_00320 [Candidatus Poribacteria bacterium]|nr:MAG: hypothetical protein C6497_00320 [Candidatus Poribacteria bacterium]
MVLFGRKEGRSLFGKQKEKEDKTPLKNELVDISINSMIELSDLTTYEETGDTSHAFKLVTRKKYEGEALLRYMYHIKDAEEEVILGVDHIPGTKDEYETSRWIVDGEQELGDPLPDVMTLFYPNPDNEEEEIGVEYTRQEIISAKLTVTDVQGKEEFQTELHEYITENEELMSIELCGDWLTFYVGLPILPSDVEVYPAIETEKTGS